LWVFFKLLCQLSPPTLNTILYKSALRTLAFGGSVGLFGEAPPNAAHSAP
jgi:hypothetical protein